MRKTFLTGTLASVAAIAVAATGVAAGTPAITKVTPGSGKTVGKNFTVKVSFKNFKIDGKNVGKRNGTNRGHVHFQLDGGKFDKKKYSGANGALGQKLGVPYSPSTTPSVTYKGIPKGKHTLKVFLVRNDHSDYGGKATVTRTITVR